MLFSLLKSVKSQCLLYISFINMGNLSLGCWYGPCSWCCFWCLISWKFMTLWLLCWRGMARHCNYLGDLLLALSFSLPCGTRYFSSSYYSAFIIHHSKFHMQTISITRVKLFLQFTGSILLSNLSCNSTNMERKKRWSSMCGKV